MKKGIFISCPALSAYKHENAWDNGKENFNSVDKDITPDKGLLTVMKKFACNGKVKSAVLRITSLGIFEALLNGKRIGRDGVYDELTPLWTDYKHRVFEYEYDILPYMNKKGENIFTARVSAGWWSGRISFGAYGYKKVALCAEIEITYKDGTTEIIASDENWNTTVAGPVLFADIWDGEWFDATIPDPAVKPESFDWCKAEKFDDYTCKIVPFEGEYVRVNDYMAPKSAVVWRGTKKNGSPYGAIHVIKKAVGDNCECITLKAGQQLILDFGRNIVGRPALAVNASNGTIVRCSFAEMLNDSGDPERGNDGPEGSMYIKNYRSALARFNYVAASSGSRKQLNIIRPIHTFYGFRYMQIVADKDIVIECVTGEVVGSALNGLGTFECSDAMINKLYSNIEWGMKGNYLSVPTDCPQRDERLGWTGDTQIFCGAASYIADTQAFLRKWLGDARDSQKGFDGGYADVIPRVLPDHLTGSAAWADAGLVVPYKLWLMYGNEDVVAENYEAMEQYMEFLAKQDPAGPRTTFGDWLAYDPTDFRYISVCYYAYDASLMQKFSEILGKKERARYYGELRGKILDTFHSEFVVDGEITQTSQTAYILPLCFDMLHGELREKTIKNLEKKIIENNYVLSSGFVGTGHLNQTLAKVGLNNLAYSLLLQTADPSWLYSVKQGATTIWERWNSYTKARGFGDVGMNSFNHYAYGVVAEWMYSAMAGIRPDENAPGFEEHFILAPMPDTRTDDELPEGQSRITMVNATYRGISSRWEYEEGRFVWSAVIPDGSATVEFPLLYGQKTIEINGVQFTARELDGEIKDDKMVFELSAGSYTIK